MHTPSRPLVAAAIALVLAIPAFAQISLTVVNPGFESAVSAGFPTTAGTWQGDTNAIAAAGTVTPYAGSSMLSFLRNGLPDGTNGSSSDTFQLVDLSAYASSIAAGGFTVTLSAYYNRSDSTYNQFTTAILSFNGTLANFETDLAATGNLGRARNSTNLNSDFNTATWELSSVSLTLPTDTTYIAVELSMASGVNAPGIPTGYYADNVTLTAVPEPSTYGALAGLGALGLVVWRRRKTHAAA
jgi:hypothetical protein